jgi:L-histidine Nalpha-methyltransferase
MSYLSTDTVESVLIENYLPEIGEKQLITEMLAGLKAKQKYISSKFFYDQKGSELFEAITQLDAYYPTRTEKAILQSAASVFGKKYDLQRIVELGSGDCSKISLFLHAIDSSQHKSIQYVPVDISWSAVEKSMHQLGSMFPEIAMQGLVADIFTQMDCVPTTNERSLYCFFGSTLGNFDPDLRLNFLQQVSRSMSSGDMFLLGIDRVKETEVLEKAYNDPEGITAAFNLNILSVANQLIGSHFNPENFAHKAFYNSEKKRIEMHLLALENMEIAHNYSDEPLLFSKGETIHTENSCKFEDEDVVQWCKQSGLELLEIFTDENHWFSELLFVKP